MSEVDELRQVLVEYARAKAEGGMTIRELGEATGRSQETVRRWLRRIGVERAGDRQERGIDGVMRPVPTYRLREGCIAGGNL